MDCPIDCGCSVCISSRLPCPFRHKQDFQDSEEGLLDSAIYRLEPTGWNYKTDSEHYKIVRGKTKIEVFESKDDAKQFIKKYLCSHYQSAK